MPCHRFGEDLHFACVIGIAYVIHIALRGREARAILGDNIDARIRAMQPNRRRRTRNIQNHSDPVLMHPGDDLVPPRKIELALGGLERIPGKISNAHDIESGMLHDVNIAIDLFRCAIDGLITSPDKKLPGAGPVWMRRRILCSRRRNKAGYEDERQCEFSK